MKSPFTVGVHIRTGSYSVNRFDDLIATFSTEERAIAFIKLLQEVEAFNPSNDNLKVLFKPTLEDFINPPKPPTPIG
jgi:hypothetical protein